MDEAPPQPPVNEVVLSVAIKRQDDLIGPLLPQILGEWFTTHPQVRQAPPTWDWEKDEPRLGLNLTARSTELTKNSINEALQFLDHAHGEVGSTFLGLLTREARTIWGLQ